MRLQRVSAIFFALVVTALGANALLLWLIYESYDRVVAAQDHRHKSLDMTNQLYRETEQLSRMVRAFTATGEIRYLTYYYDIMAVRNGEMPAPEVAVRSSYWDDVIAGRVQHRMPASGPTQTVSALLKSQGFSEDELQALQQVLIISAKLNSAWPKSKKCYTNQWVT